MRTTTGAVHPEDTLARAAERMAALGVREVPVTTDDRVEGILSQSDLLPHRGHYEWTQVQDVMTRDVTVVAPGTPIADLARLLLDRGINAVPVVVDGRLVGMVSRAELLRPLAAPGGVQGTDGNGGASGNGNGHSRRGTGHGVLRKGGAGERDGRSVDRSPPPG